MAKREQSDIGGDTNGERVRRPRKKKRLLRRLMLFGLVAVIGLVALAPTIASRLALRYELLSEAMPEGWTLDSEQASFGWLSDQTLTGVIIADAEGNTLLAVESITVARSLATLVLDQSDLGEIKIIRPVATLETRSDGSNWEDLVTDLLAMSSESPTDPSAPAVKLRVEIVEGKIHGLDRQSGEPWSLENAHLTVAIQETLSAQGSAELLAGNSPRRGKINFQWQPAEQSGVQQLELLTERLPLAALKPWLTRFAPDLELLGSLSTDAKLTWQKDPNTGLSLESTARIEASQLQLTGPALQNDRLTTQKFINTWNLTYSNKQLTIHQLALETDWAKVSAHGTVTLAELQALSLEKPLSLKNLPQQAAQLTGEIDLAQLAAMLPRTLQLRPGVRLDTGRLEFSAAAKPAAAKLINTVSTGSTPQRLTWQANATLENVAGRDGPRQIRWTQPIVASVNLRETPTGAQLEQLTLTAPFVNATVQTKQDAIEGNFSLDLEKFSQDLSQFVDLQAWQLRGQGAGTFSLTSQADQQFTATANLELTDLHVAKAGEQNAWTEPRLNVELVATGLEQELKPIKLSTGKVTLRGPVDQLVWQLLQPVDLVAKHQPWNLQVEGNGPLASWSSRLRPWLETLPAELEGDAHLKAKLIVSDEAVEIVESNGSVVQLRVHDGSLMVDEPRIEFSGDGRWDFQTESLRTQEMQLLGSTFSFRAQDVAIGFAAQGAPPARGSVAFRADLERLAAMGGLVGQPGGTWPRGTAVGKVQLTSPEEQVQADFEMKIEQLKLVKDNGDRGAAYGQPEMVWEEPQIELRGLLKYEAANDRVQLDNLHVNGKTLQLSGSTTLDRMSQEGFLQANGLLTYDSQELSKLIASYAGPGVLLHGDRQVRFNFAGPLFVTETITHGASNNANNSEAAIQLSQQWEVTTEAGWESASAYGLLLGGGRLSGEFNKGQLTISPLDVSVGQGRLTMEPMVRWMPSPAHLALKPGLLVSNVDISPEVSEKMLKYVAPILAGATRARGQFSIDLTEAMIPFGQPEQARVQGHLVAHRLQVSPGPMMNQLRTLVKQIESLIKEKRLLAAAPAARNKSFLTMAEQKVEFKVFGGRVYHRNLEFFIDDTPVRSRGSVGFDQTLSIVLEVPIQDRWIANEPALRSLAGQVLQLPVHGTFDNPQIDQRAVTDLSKRLLQGVAKQAIGDELNRQFEKLFRKK